MLNVLIQTLWIIASIMIFVCGIYFSFKLNFINLNFKKIWNSLKQKSEKKDSISAFQSLTMSLAGRIGVGSLSGIALALYLGGPGVLLWIWLTSILCSSTSLAESVLAVVFRKKDFGNVYRGGPFYYINDGMKSHKLAIFYAFVVIFSYIGGFMTIQVNTVSKCMNDLVNINPIIIGIIVAIITSITIFGGVQKIANMTSKLVPFMTLTYLFVCFCIIFSNFSMIKPILYTIINSAFNFKTFGAGIVSTLLIGMQKGIFSSEVGLGTGSIAAVTADTKTAIDNGLVQTFGIHIENLLFATITTFVICMSDYSNLIFPDANGIEITLYAFKYHMGNIGPLFITVIITLFALATVLTGYYYGESSLKFIKKTNTTELLILKLITIIVIIIGSVISSNLLWLIIDVLVGLLAITNVYALFELKDIVINEYSNYKFKFVKKK